MNKSEINANIFFGQTIEEIAKKYIAKNGTKVIKNLKIKCDLGLDFYVLINQEEIPVIKFTPGAFNYKLNPETEHCQEFNNLTDCLDELIHQLRVSSKT
jgi:hypothetical protein